MFLIKLRILDGHGFSLQHEKYAVYGVLVKLLVLAPVLLPLVLPAIGLVMSHIVVKGGISRTTPL